MVAAPTRPLLSVRALAALALVLAPAVLAFFSGGFFDQPRLWAAVTIWIGLVVAALVGAPVIPHRTGGRLALAGLVVLSAWTLASLAWAPLSERALDDGQRALLYLGAFAAAVALFRGARVAGLVEPLLAGGTVVAIGYGLAGRLLPGIVHEHPSRQALGRLDQPLTYWNAVGAVAAIGLVLCARLAYGRARDGRPASVAGRALAAAACVPLGAGLYLTFSRGGIVAAIVGLIALVALLPPDARRTLALATAGAISGAIAVAFLPQVTHPHGGGGEGQGVVALALLVVGAATVVALQTRSAGTAVRRRRSSAGDGSSVSSDARGPVEDAWSVRPTSAVDRRSGFPIVVVGMVLLVVAALALAGVRGLGGERVVRDPPDGASVRRLSSVESQRYDYWDVAVRAFAAQPLKGTGAGGFKVEWRREQPLGSAPASDAHSLYLETAAELGVVGLAALALLFAGVALAAARALWLHRALAAGPIAALVAWALHAGLDWDWEMPAVTMIAVLLAGLLAALAEEA